MSDILPPAQTLPLLEIIGGIFALIGLLCLIPAIRSLREEIDSRSWPQIEAVLRDAEAVKTIYEENEKRHYRRFVSYQVALTYRYEVQGKSYDAVTRKNAESEEQAGIMAKEAALGEVRKLYYNPARPERHRFTLNALTDSLFWFIPVIGFTGFGALVFYTGRKFY